MADSRNINLKFSKIGLLIDIVDVVVVIVYQKPTFKVWSKLGH